MKNTILTLLVTLLISISSFAQQGINYKALIKDDLGNVVAGQPIGVQFQIREATANGSAVYTETHTPTTDANGIMVLNIGTGNSSDIFSAIDWSSLDHWLNVQIDLAGGTNFTDMSTTQFMAVPYALHALNASNDYWSKEGSTTYNLDDRIGIGSDTLVAKLGVFHDGSENDPHLYLYENANDFATIKMGNTNSASSWYINAWLTSSEFGTNDQLNIYNDRTNKAIMRLHSNGNVSFGNPNPYSQIANFHVGKDKSVLFGEFTTLDGSKLMWLPDISAFRVGTIDEGAQSSYWNLDNIGTYSFASGRNTRAQGNNATAMGYGTNASGLFSTAMGSGTVASGSFSIAMGSDSTTASGTKSTAIGPGATARSAHETALGAYNTDYTPNNTESDRLLVIGNGGFENGMLVRSNALTILKNGNAIFDAEIQRPATGTADMIPIAYGIVESNDNILASTGNFTATVSSGVFTIDVEGESLSYSNTVCVITPITSSARTSSTIISNGNMIVRIFNSSGSLTATTFQFVLYKL